MEDSRLSNKPVGVHLKVTMTRHIGDRVEQFVEWTPEDM